MNVGVVIAPIGSRGGVYHWARNLSSLFREMGHSTLFLVGSRPGIHPTSWDWGDDDVADVGELPRLPSRHTSRDVHDWVRDRRIEVVMSALPYAGVLVGQLSGCVRHRPVITLHGKRPNGVRGAFYEWALRRVARSATVVGVSDSTLESYHVNGWATSTCTIRTWLEPDEVRRLKVRSEYGRRALTYVGRLEREKGVSDLITILDGVTHVPAVVAGAGSEASRVEKALNRRGRSQFLGWIDHPFEALPRGVTILTAAHEGAPFTLLEAIAAGSVPLVRCEELAAELGLPHECRFRSTTEAISAARDLFAMASARFDDVHRACAAAVRLRSSRELAFDSWADVLDR